MKKFQILFLILSVAITFACSFVDPVLAAGSGVVLASLGVAWPMGNIDQQSPTYAATLAITITDQFTQIAPSILTGALTINLTIDGDVRAGAMIHLLIKATGTEVTTLGTGFTGPTFAGVAGKTKSQLLIYDGTTFKPTAVAFQID